MAVEFYATGLTLQEVATLVNDLPDEHFHDFFVYLAESLESNRDLKKFMKRLNDCLVEIDECNSYVQEHFTLICPICRKVVDLNDLGPHIKQEHVDIYNIIKEMK